MSCTTRGWDKPTSGAISRVDMPAPWASRISRSRSARACSSRFRLSGSAARRLSIRCALANATISLLIGREAINPPKTPDAQRTTRSDRGGAYAAAR
jgi:hypothetical protein